MEIRSNLGDRRACLRFQLKGEMWASVAVSADVVIRNVAAGGALIEATFGSSLRSIHAAQISLPGHSAEVMVLVRHISPLSQSDGGERVLCGVEFVNLTNADRAAIADFIRACRSAATSPAK